MKLRSTEKTSYFIVNQFTYGETKFYLWQTEICSRSKHLKKVAKSTEADEIIIAVCIDMHL